jgi:hypothetical protein
MKTKADALLPNQAKLTFGPMASAHRRISASTTFFFAGVALLISVACWMLLFDFRIAAGCFSAAIFVCLRLLSPSFRSRQRGELWLTVGVFVAVWLLITSCNLSWVSSSASTAIRSVVCHPAFVAPFWLFMLWGLYRHWQAQKG